MLLEISYIFEAFEVGLQSNVVIPPLPITHFLKNNYITFVNQKTTPKMAQFFEDSMAKREAILKFAQNGWVSQAEIAYQKLTESYSPKIEEQPFQTLLDSQDYPLQAFIEYQKHEFAKAKISLDKGIEADWILESQHDFHELLFHRIHLIHNKAKVLWKENDTANAIQMMLAILTNMASPQKNLFLHPICFEGNATSHNYATILFYSVNDSLALLRKSAPDLFLEIVKKQEPLPDLSNSYATTLQNIFEFLLNPSIKNPTLKILLQAGSREAAGFWFTALAVFHKWCEENEPYYATEIIRKLESKKVPSFWIKFVKSS